MSLFDTVLIAKNRSGFARMRRNAGLKILLKVEWKSWRYDMSRKLSVTVACGVLLALVASTAFAGPLFVATAKNLRGAIYLGHGPSPHIASEQAIAKCSQNSFIPATCKILCVRAECPPPVCAAPPCPPPKVKKRAYKMRPYRQPKVQQSAYCPPWGCPTP